jgi:hypothetical protein
MILVTQRSPGHPRPSPTLRSPGGLVVTNFVNAFRTADTLLEVARFIREAHTASRRSGEKVPSVHASASTPAVADLRHAFPELFGSAR